MIRFFALCLIFGGLVVLWNTPFTKVFTIENPIRTDAKAQDWRVEILSILKEYKINLNEAQAIMFCESSMNPRATHLNNDKTYDKGIWMLNDVHKVPDDIRFDPVAATYAMIPLYEARGWKPWVVYKSKCYYKELARLSTIQK